MKGVPISQTVVMGELRKEALEIVYKHRQNGNYINGLGYTLSRLISGTLRLNGLVGMLNKLGYKLEIKIIKK